MNAHVQMKGPLATASKFYLEGEITEATPALVRQFLDENSQTAVIVQINSPGGLASQGVSIFNTLASHPKGVDIVISGMAASSASLIAMAGRMIFIMPGSFMMIHDPASMAFGPADTMRDVADNLDKMSEVYANIYAKRSGQPVSKVRQMMRDETWMTPDEAVKFGFADEVLEGQATEPAAYAYSKFSNAPSQLLSLPSHKRDDKMTKQITENIDDSMALSPTMGAKIIAEITARCKAARLDANASMKVLTECGGDPEKAKDMIINMIADRDPSGGRVTYMHTSDSTFENPNFTSNAVQSALYARMSGKAPEGAAVEFMGLSVLEIGRAILQAQGVRDIPKNPDRLASFLMSSAGSHSTSDFPTILAGAAGRVLLEAYMAAQSPLKTLARVRNATDFRAITVARLSEMAKLDKVDEGGEVTYGSRSEAVEAYRLATFGKMFAITRQALINDDLSAFSDAPKAFGAAAAATEAEEIVALFTANSGFAVTLDDALPVFDASRGNVAAAGVAPSIASLSEARLALRTVKGLDGKTILAATPKYLVVGPELESAAESLVAQITAASVADVNVFSQKLEVLVESRFEGPQWFLFADPAQMPTLEIAYLNGMTSPQIETRPGWNVLGTEFRAILDFGCGFAGWRGAFMNEGA